MTNEGLVLLSDAGFSDSFIAVKIQLSRTRFDTSAEGLASLRRNSISEELVMFVLEHAAGPAMGVPAPEAQAMVETKVVKRKISIAIEPPPAEPESVAAPKAKRRWPWSRALWCGSPPAPAAPAADAAPGYANVVYTRRAAPYCNRRYFPRARRF